MVAEVGQRSFDRITEQRERGERLVEELRRAEREVPGHDADLGAPEPPPFEQVLHREHRRRRLSVARARIQLGGVELLVQPAPERGSTRLLEMEEEEASGVGHRPAVDDVLRRSGGGTHPGGTSGRASPMTCPGRNRRRAPGSCVLPRSVPGRTPARRDGRSRSCSRRRRRTRRAPAARAPGTPGRCGAPRSRTRG